MENYNQDNQAPLVFLQAGAPSLDSTPANPSDRTNIPNTNDRVSSSSSSKDFYEEKPKIPDGGYGWVIVVASLIMTLIVNGIRASFALLHIEFLEEFQESNTVTSWIGSLFLSVPLLTGPIMSALVDRYGCKSMTIVSGVISAAGFVLGSRCHTIALLNLTIGILTGIGQGLNFVTSVVSIAFWFEKKRALAVGIGASGTGIGVFIFGPLTAFWINEYCWRGTTLLLAGCFLNTCVCGALMRDPGWIIEQTRKKSKSKPEKSIKTSLVSVSSENASNAIDTNELQSLLTNGKDVEFLIKDLEPSLESNKDLNKTYSHSAFNLPTFIKQNGKDPMEVLQLLSANNNEYISQNYSCMVTRRSSSVDNYSDNLKNDPTNLVPVGFSMKLKKEEPPQLESKKNEPISHQIFMSAAHEASNETLPSAFSSRCKQACHTTHHENYLKSLKLHRKSLTHGNATFDMNKFSFKAFSCPNIQRLSVMSQPKPSAGKKWFSEIADFLKGMFDCSLFLELHFLLLSLSTTALSMWSIVPYFYLAQLMVEYGYTTEDASFTISNIGIANTIGMIFLGWAGDRPWMNKTKTYSLCLILCGVFIGAMMFYVESFIALEVFTALFGLFVSSSFSFTPAILGEIVPLERFTISYGLQLLCMGIGTLVGPPFSGFLYDVTGSWHQTFYQAALWILLSAVLVGLMPYTKNRRIIGKAKTEKEIEGSEDRVIPIVLLLIALVLIVVFLIYLTVVSFLLKDVPV